MVLGSGRCVGAMMRESPVVDAAGSSRPSLMLVMQNVWPLRVVIDPE